MGFGYFLNKYISKEKLSPDVTKQQILEQWLNLAKMRQNWRLEGPDWETSPLVSEMWTSVMRAPLPPELAAIQPHRLAESSAHLSLWVCRSDGKQAHEKMHSVTNC